MPKEFPPEGLENSDAYLEAYELSVGSDKEIELWVEKFSRSPVDFFEESNLNTLKEVDVGTRMFWLSMSLVDLRVTPDIANRYFEVFPNELDAFKSYIESQRLPRSSREYNLWAICAGLGEDIKEPSSEGVGFVQSDKWAAVHDRRKLAPAHLLSNYSFDIFRRISDFGEASKEFLETFDNANSQSLGLDERLETGNMFQGEAYDKLPTADKIRFLQTALSILQYSLVFEETNNSVFSAASVKRFNQTSRHNVAHSMLYGTFQPSNAYNQAQEWFQYQMDNTAAHGGAVEEYPHHRMLLAVLDEIKKVKDDTGETTDLLVEFWDKNRNPIFANATTEALVAQDPHRAAKGLLEKIKGEAKNKNALTAVLYRLEFGRIGVSESGVRYLEKMYDLAEQNDPNYFVRRLTPNGEVGVFDGNDQLTGYFKLAEVDSLDDVVKARVMEFVYETLFIPKPDETEEQKKEREEYVAEFQKGYFGFADGELFHNTEADLNNLTFKEQGALFVVWQKADHVEKNRIVQMTKRLGENGLKFFILLNLEGEEFKGYVLDLFERFNDEDAEKICISVAKILAELNHFDEVIGEVGEDELSDDLKNDPFAQIERRRRVKNVASGKIPQRVRTKILNRVVDLIKGGNPETICKKIEAVSAEAILMQSIVQSTERERIDFNDLPDTDLFTGENYTITPDQIRAIKEIYRKNYKDRPKMLAQLLEGFDESLKKPNAEFQTLFFKGELVGVVVFEYNGDQVYFGKFNIDPDFQGGRIGEKMMEETLDEVMNKHIVTATCSKGAPVTPKYIERGFVAEGQFQFEEDSSLNIVSNKSMNSIFISKQYTEEMVMDNVIPFQWNEFEDGRCRVMMTRLENVAETDFSILEEGDEKWVVTRFFKRKLTEEENFAIIVIEKVPKKLFEEYKTKIDRGPTLSSRS